MVNQITKKVIDEATYNKLMNLEPDCFDNIFTKKGDGYESTTEDLVAALDRMSNSSKAQMAALIIEVNGSEAEEAGLSESVVERMVHVRKGYEITEEQANFSASGLPFLSLESWDVSKENVGPFSIDKLYKFHFKTISKIRAEKVEYALLSIKSIKKRLKTNKERGILFHKYYGLTIDCSGICGEHTVTPKRFFALMGYTNIRKNYGFHSSLARLFDFSVCTKEQNRNFAPFLYPGFEYLAKSIIDGELGLHPGLVGTIYAMATKCDYLGYSQNCKQRRVTPLSFECWLTSGSLEQFSLATLLKNLNMVSLKGPDLTEDQIEFAKDILKNVKMPCWLAGSQLDDPAS